MTRLPPLIAIGHGSRDPRSTETITRLVRRVRAAAPALAAHAAFLELSEPAFGDVLDALHAEGHPELVVVPLLLGSAYHARTDIPGVLAEFHARRAGTAVSVAEVLAPDERLETLLLRRLSELGVPHHDPELGVLIGAAGSSQQQANDAVAEVAARCALRGNWAGVRAAFASATPDVSTAIDELRAAGARRIAVASWFLAPGRLPDAVNAAARQFDPGVPIAEPLGAADEVVEVVLERYASAAGLRRTQVRVLD